MYNGEDNAWAQKSFDMSAFAGRFVRVQFFAANNDPPPLNDFYSDIFLCSGGTITWYDYDDTNVRDDIYIDNVESGRSDKNTKETQEQ